MDDALLEAASAAKAADGPPPWRGRIRSALSLGSFARSSTTATFPAQRAFDFAARRTPLTVAMLDNHTPALVAAIALAGYTLIGILLFHFTAMHLTWADAFYFAVTTTTTVGYGDISPSKPIVETHNGSSVTVYTPSDGLLILTALYICGGVCVIGTSLGLILQRMLQALERPLVRSSSSTSSCRSPLTDTALLFVVVLTVGAASICALEGWRPAVGFYWSVVTMSTVGYGGEHPRTEAGKLFAAGFMLIGVMIAARLVAEFSALPLYAHRRRLELAVLRQYGDVLEEEELWELACGEQLQTLGLSESPAYVTRNEFTIAMLVRMHKLEERDLRMCQEAFGKLDVDRSGRLDMNDVRAHQRGAVSSRSIRVHDAEEEQAAGERPAADGSAHAQ